MTQARNYPKTTTTLSDNNFISDDGTTTFTNKTDVIKNAYNFLIGSVVFLNETEGTVYDENEFRKITYLKYNGESDLLTSITVNKYLNPSYISSDGLTCLKWNAGEPMGMFSLFKNFKEQQGNKDGFLVRIIENNSSNYTFNLNVTNFFNQMKAGFKDIKAKEGKQAFIQIGATLLIRESYTPQSESTGLMTNLTLDSSNNLISADVTIDQQITLEEIPFGTKNYTSSGLTMEIIDQYPVLKNRFQEHNITQLLQGISDYNYFLGYMESFQVVNFQEEEHAHKIITTANENVVFQRVVPMVNGEVNRWSFSTNNIIRNYFANIDISYGENKQLTSPTSTSTIPAGERTRVNSYSSTPYVIAQIDWK